LVLARAVWSDASGPVGSADDSRSKIGEGVMFAFEWDYDYDDRLAEQQRARHERELGRHPDCADPEHPGCDACFDEE
jgi:hypothetical protein